MNSYPVMIMIRGFADRRIIEIYLELANIHSPPLKCGAIDFFCHGMSSSDVARKYGIERRNLLRVRKAVSDVDDKVELIYRIRCGLC